MVIAGLHSHIEKARRDPTLAHRALPEDLTDTTDRRSTPRPAPHQPVSSLMEKTGRQPGTDLPAPDGSPGRCRQSNRRLGTVVHRARCWAGPLLGDREQNNPETPPATQPEICGRRRS